ncbi:MAG TPA: AI-2E family transporter [Acetobacteraceae bacterium]|jgi:AI-2 transport protein TqsA|nr:AI-2E family transporter [Acetobacteraceae bacterium]
MAPAEGSSTTRDALQKARRTSDRGLRAMVGVGTAILVVTALGIARPVFAPLTFALFIIAIVWPLQARLQARLPKLVALAVSILATIVVIGAFAWVITWGLNRVGRYIVTDFARFQLLYNQMTDWLEGHGIVVESLWAEHFNVGWVLRAFQEITTRINGTLSFSLVVLIYVILGLMEVDDAARRLRGMKNHEAGRVLLTGGALTAAKFRRYLLVRSLMSVVTGFLVWGFISLCGLPLAQEWGVIAFALNYIPFIGPLVATVLPTLFAIAQFDAWQNAILVFGCLNLIQFLVGSYLEPRIAGNILSMSPFMVLFAVFFWTYLWGIAGAFIGVPIVIAVLTICEQYASSRWVTEVFGAPVTARD